MLESETQLTESAPIRIAAFAGSLRRASLNRGLVRAAAEVAPEDVTVQIVELGDVPMYNPDVESIGTPPAAQAFKQALFEADALLIATPEYNYSVTGALKNALDWASRRMGPDMPPAMQDKPAAMMGAGGRFGTVRAQAHLRYMLLHNDVKVLANPQVMLARARDKFDADGNLVDEETRGEIRELVEALAAWTRQLCK